MKLIEEIKIISEKGNLNIDFNLPHKDFIREFKEDVDWYCISEHQSLSEDFIKEFKENVHWYWISQCQTLSEDFIREFKDQVHWGRISRHQTLSEGFIREFNLTIPKSNWIYASDEDKHKAIESSGLYEVKDGYVYGYKTVDKYMRSVFRSTYHYKLGEIHRSRCDFNCDVENSYGLSMWSKEGALGYHGQGIMLRVRAKLSHVGAMVHYKHKLRCVELEVLNVEK